MKYQRVNFKPKFSTSSHIFTLAMRFHNPLKPFYFLVFFLAFIQHILTPLLVNGQNKVTLSGYVKDQETGEDLIGVNIYTPDKQAGTLTNTYGYFALSVPKNNDSIVVVYSFVGYEEKSITILASQDQMVQVYLTGRANNLEEVVVKAETIEEKLNSTQMSVEKLTMEEVKNIPVIFGEVDIIKVLQLKPGVKSGGEGQAGLFVRGGGNDQNLVMLDDVLIYNPTHLFGFFSVFNPDALKGVDLYKGDFPAQFGGRLSSILDVKLREGNQRKFSVSGGVGLIASRFTVEGPIQRDKSSFILSGRRTYVDIFTRLVNEANKGDRNFSPIPDYYFYDLNLKANYAIGKKDRIFLSGYFGRDVFGFRQNNFNFTFRWGNSSIALRWNRIISPKLFVNTSLFYTGYQYNIENRFDIIRFNISSDVQDMGAKVDFDYLASSKHNIKFGIHYTQHQFLVGRIQLGSDDGTVDFLTENRLFSQQGAVYFADDWTASDRWRFNFGFRLSGFQYQNTQYGGFEPRFSARYKVSEKVSLKASLNRMYQYLHLVSNSGASIPTDIWYPSTRVALPQIADQAALGVQASLFGGKILLSNEVYYKYLTNQLDLRDGARIFGNPNLEAEFVVGRGWSYGNEFYLEKKEGRTTGWIGYTLSWTQRQFGPSNGNPAINNGEPFFPRFDRRHDFSFVLTHRLSKRLLFTLTWVFNTGNAYSLPEGRFFLQNVPGGNTVVVPVFQGRNTFRLPDYHRLDLGLVWQLNPKRGTSDLTFSIYNVYNRRNAYFVFFEEIKNTTTNIITGFRAREVSLFPIIPTITYNFKF